MSARHTALAKMNLLLTITNQAHFTFPENDYFSCYKLDDIDIFYKASLPRGYCGCIEIYQEWIVTFNNCYLWKCFCVLGIKDLCINNPEGVYF